MLDVGHSPPPGVRSYDRRTATLARILLADAVACELEDWEPGRRDILEIGPGRGGEMPGTLSFPRTDSGEHRLRPGREVSLELRGQSPAVAVVVRASEESVVLRVAGACLRTPTPPGRIIQDARWINHALRRALLQGGRLDDDGLSLALLGAQNVGVGGASPTPAFSDATLNAEQRRAVAESLRNGVLYLHGPPGTGKTRTVAAIVQAQVEAGRSLLVVAPTNKAVDEVALRVARLLSNHPDFGRGLIIRYGEPVLPQLRREYGRDLHLETAARRLLGPTAADDEDFSEILVRRMSEILETCPVLITTAARAHLMPSRRRFDSVVMDEAAMMALPLAYQVATRASRSLVVAGDPCQLPAVTQSKKRSAQSFYRTDAFRAAGLNLDGAQADRLPGMVQLREQYRMDPPIQELVDHVSYGGILRTASSIHGRRPVRGSLGSLVLIDTSCRPRRRDPLRRKVDLRSAHIISGIVRRLLRRDPAVSISVLSRYVDQASIHREAFENLPNVCAGTIHRFQGGEDHTIILDLCARGGSVPGDILVDGSSTSEGVRLLTVAVSRARRRLIVVADVPLVLHHPRIAHASASRKLIRYLLEYGEVLPERTSAEGVG